MRGFGGVIAMLQNEENSPPPVDLVTAREELRRMCDRCAIDPVVTDADDKKFIDRIVGYISAGVLTVDEDGRAVFKLQSDRDKPVDSITYDEPSGRALAAQDLVGEKLSEAVFVFTAEMCNANGGSTSRAAMKRLRKRDYDVARDMLMFFLL